jgi:outer membrane protein OmpA-like peptidoglycan-associated protein
MKARYWILMAALVLAGCQTTPPKPSPSPTATPEPTPSPTPTPEPTVEPTPSPAPDGSLITPSDRGFSPLAPAPHNTLSFTLHLGHPDTVTAWSVAVTGPSGLVRTVEGNKTIPTWTWDGTTDGPKLVDGEYKATLTVAHGDDKETVETAPFIVDVTPPSGSVTVAPQPFAPGAEGDAGKVTFTVTTKAGGADVATWRLFIIHPDGRKFTDFISENSNSNQVVWDGHDQSNNTLEAGVTYKVSVQVVDRFDNTGTFDSTLAVAPSTVMAPVTVSLDGAVIAQMQVYFPANSADLSAVVDPSKAKNNGTTLDKLATLLGDAPSSKIRVVGHANQVLWQDPAKAKYEQTETLIPLSKARAQAVLNELKKRGLEGKLFDLTGVGAEGNVVPFSDYPNTWKNRRVEFILER